MSCSAVFKLCLVGVVWIALSACSAPEQGPGTRIVLITLDTLRYDRLPTECSAACPMPELSDWAQGATVFRHAYAASSSTQPTHASLLTGLHPWLHGVTRNGLVLDESVEVITERLKSAGYTTAAVVAAFPLHRQFGFARGFDEYHADFDQLRGPDAWLGFHVKDRAFYSRAEQITNTAIDVLDRSKGSKQFFWFHYFDPHSPYGDSTGGRRIHLRELLGLARGKDPELQRRISRAVELYDADADALDGQLARLLQHLDRTSSMHVTTHLIVTSDHGESFGESGFLGHSKQVTPEQVKVPLLIKSPRMQPGVRDDTAGSVDVAATILALAEIEAGETRGRNLLETTISGAPEGFGMRRSVTGEVFDSLVDGSVIRIDGNRFFYASGELVVSGNAEGVRLEAPRGASIEPRRAAEMTRLFASFEAALAEAPGREVLDRESQEILRSLGYID